MNPYIKNIISNVKLNNFFGKSVTSWFGVLVTHETHDISNKSYMGLKEKGKKG